MAAYDSRLNWLQERIARDYPGANWTNPSAFAWMTKIEGGTLTCALTTGTVVVAGKPLSTGYGYLKQVEHEYREHFQNGSSPLRYEVQEERSAQALSTKKMRLLAAASSLKVARNSLESAARMLDQALDDP